MARRLGGSSVEKTRKVSENIYFIGGFIVLDGSAARQSTRLASRRAIRVILL